MAENCNLGSEETTLIRDAFILNMLDHETQKELLKETVDPPKALEIAIQMEMGAQNQQKINQNLMSGNTSVNYINNNSMSNRNANGPSTKRDSTRYASIPKNRMTNKAQEKRSERFASMKSSGSSNKLVIVERRS